MSTYAPPQQWGNSGMNVSTSVDIQNTTQSSVGAPVLSLQGASRSRHWTGNMTRTIAHYQRLEQIGEGAYGQVYKARCKQTGRYVALKKLIIQHGGYNGMTPSVIREIKILQRLRHPRLVQMIEVVSSKGVEHLDEHDDHKNSNSRIIDSREGFKGNLFLVLEYVSHDLMALLDIRYQFTELQIKCIFKQLLEALEYMHSQKYLHRDLKPANILIDSHHRLKLADFGLARNIEPPILDKLHDRHSTQEFTNKVVTVMYRPPEILLGATRYGYAVDMWSAGCILGELVLGKTLLPGKVELEQLQLIFDMLGTPTSSDGLSNLKLLKTGEVKIEKVKKSRLRDKYISKMSLAALNLLEKLLELDPKKRLSASRAKDARWFKTEPRAPDYPEQLGVLQLGDSQGEFHEFQTKKKRKEAKSIANAAKEEAKEQGMSDDQADTIFKEVYDEQMKRVKEEGVSALLTKEEQEKEDNKRHRSERNSKDHSDRRREDRKERKRSRAADSRKGLDDEDPKRRKSGRDEEDRSRKSDRDKDRKSETREERRERRKSEREERRERKRDDDRKRGSDHSKRPDDLDMVTSVGENRSGCNGDGDKEPQISGTKSDLGNGGEKPHEREDFGQKIQDRRNKAGARSRDRKLNSSRGDGTDRRDRDRGKDRDKESYRGRDEDRPYGDREKRDQKDRDDRRGHDRERGSRRGLDRDFDFDRRPIDDVNRYGPPVRESFQNIPPMWRADGPPPKDRDHFGTDSRGPPAVIGYYGPTDKFKGRSNFRDGSHREWDDRALSLYDDRGPPRKDRGPPMRDGRIPPNQDSRVPSRDRGPPTRDDRGGPPSDRDGRGSVGDRGGRGVGAARPPRDWDNRSARDGPRRDRDLGPTAHDNRGLIRRDRSPARRERDWDRRRR